jgi:RimJ/RimL family protein N-acetyltransferase
VHLRPVEPADLEVFFQNQRDQESVALADVPAREREAFDAHWAKILVDPATAIRTVVVDDQVVGNVLSFPLNGLQMVGYWIGREHWGRGYASAALSQFLEVETQRPLHAHVATHNAGSMRVLQKAGFALYDRAATGVVFILV